MARSAYTGTLLVVMWTAWQSVVGWQQVGNVGDIARFGFLLFQIFALVQLALTLFFAPLSAASAITTEKDRRTFTLLLVTDLTNSEIVLGKLLGSLLQISVLLAAAFPVFALCLLLGGVSIAQVAATFALTVAVAVATGALGLVIALWRERTFQTLALTALVVVIYFLGVEGIFGVLPEGKLAGLSTADWKVVFSPFSALVAIASPGSDQGGLGRVFGPVGIGSLAYLFLASAAVTAVGIAKLRTWNLTSETLEPCESPAEHEGGVGTKSAQAQTEAVNTGDAGRETLLAPQLAGHRLGGPGARERTRRPSREVWDSPILWREIVTRAYGRRSLMIKAGYLLFFAMTLAYLYAQRGTGAEAALAIRALVPLAVLSLLLINAQAVVSVTSERDSGALDLLLVTDITPKEFIFGKLGGVFYNTKEMIVPPLVFCVLGWLGGYFSGEVFVYLSLAYLVLAAFSAMLGLHAALAHETTRAAVASSLGTVFFLFVGILICIFLILISGSFERQLPSFALFIIGGSLGLYASLGARNPSRAIALAAGMCPLLTFYSIGSILLGASLGPFLVATAAYGFATLAMLIPAVSEFDVALGRTTAHEG